MQTQPAQEFIWRKELRIIGSGIPAPTADWPSEVSRTPFSSQSKERKEECGGKATPESKDQRFPHHRSFGLFTKVCCTWIASLRADNKSTTSILRLFDVRFGAEASPINRGTLLPVGYSRARNLAHSSPVWFQRPRPT